MLEGFFVNHMKHSWQRLIFAAPSVLALNFAVCVYTILSKKERKSFISILNLPSFALCNIHNLLCPPLFFLKQKLECEKTCRVHVSVLWVRKFDFQHVFALSLTAHCSRLVFLLLFLFSFPTDSSVRVKLGWQLEKPVH